MIIVIAGMALLLCLSFLLGVGVGRNMDTYPEKIASGPQRFLAYFWRPAKIADPVKQLESRETEAGKNAVEQAPNGTPASQKTLHVPQVPDEGKKTNPDVMAQIIENPQSAQVAEAHKEKIASSREPVSRPTVVAGETPSAEKNIKAKETSANASPAGSSYVLHVASMKEKVKAGQIHKTVAAMGYSSKIVKVELKGKGTWYRVMATGFETKAQAQAASEKISEKVKTNCIIRSVGQNTGKSQ